MLRPVLVCLALSGVGLSTASCGMMEDPNRFQAMADKVAQIPLDGSVGAPQAPTATAAEAEAEEGLRPAMSADDGLKVEVMDPHDLWDARDAGLRGAIQTAAREAAPRIAEAAAPAVARAVVHQVSTQVQGHAAEVAALRPAIVREPGDKPASGQARATIQLGAYSSEAAARSAWTRVNAGAARQALAGLSPVFEAVEVNGRPLTRLKVAAPAAAAVAICRAAQVTDPWCARRS